MRITNFGDIAGQVSAAHANADMVTVACVCLPSGALTNARKHLPSHLPKWRNAAPEHVEVVVSLLLKEAFAISAASVDKTTEHWRLFWQDAQDVHARTAALSGGSIGYVKAANLIKYVLLGQAATTAFAQAIKSGAIPTSLRERGVLAMTEDLVFDYEIQGQDNQEAFAAIWRATNAHQPLMHSMGIKRTISRLRLASEQAEPLLLLPDYVAGIVHAANSRADTLGQSLVSSAGARRALDRLQRSTRFVEFEDPLFMEYSQIFPDFKQYIERYAG